MTKPEPLRPPPHRVMRAPADKPVTPTVPIKIPPKDPLLARLRRVHPRRAG